MSNISSSGTLSATPENVVLETRAISWDSIFFGPQTKIFLATWVGYATFYLTRKSLTYALPGLMREHGYDTAQMGLLGTVLALSYALSKFLSGLLADRYSPKKIMIIGLMMTGIANIFLGFLTANSGLAVIFILWGINGLFQGTGAPVCAHYLVNYFPSQTRGTWWSLWNTSHNAGGAISPIIAGLCLSYFTWHSALFIPGVFALIISIYLVYGLPHHKVVNSEDLTTAAKSVQDSSLNLKSLWPLWPIFISYFMVYLLRTGIGDWIHIYLIQVKNWTAFRASAAISWFEVGGFLGGLFSGIYSDYYFKGKRVTPCYSMILGFFLSFIPLVLFSRLTEFAYLMEILIFLQGFFIFGPHSLLGMGVAEFAGKHLAASATGIAGLLGYLGAAICGWPLGIMIKHLGWNSHFLVLSILPVFILGLMRLKRF